MVENLDRFENYCHRRGLPFVYTRNGNINFWNSEGRIFQMSKSGYLRSRAKRPSSGSHGWYLVFKRTNAPAVKKSYISYDTKQEVFYRQEDRSAIRWLKDDVIDYEALFAKMDSSGLFV